MVVLEVGLGLMVFVCVGLAVCLGVCGKEAERIEEEREQRRRNVDLRSMILALRPSAGEGAPTAPPLTPLEEEEAANPQQQPPSPPPPYEEVTSQTTRKDPWSQSHSIKTCSGI